jgi:hypothetical protein
MKNVLLSLSAAWSLLGLDVFRCWTCVSSGHQHNMHTYNYIKLCHFLKYYRYQHVNVHIVFNICVYIRALLLSLDGVTKQISIDVSKKNKWINLDPTLSQSIQCGIMSLNNHRIHVNAIQTQSIGNNFIS